jgi:predicted Zn-dependent peptidase
LTQKLREELGLVYEVQSSYDAYRQVGLWSFSGVTTPAALADTLAVIEAEVADLASGRRPVDEEELVRAKRQLKAQILLGAESTHNKMSRLLTHELYFGRSLPESDLALAFDQLDREDLARAADRLLAPNLDRAAIAVVGPEP